jgi:hypothetical protein
MIAMQMADENGFYTGNVNAKAAELHLRSFASIYQKMMLFYLDVLTRRKPAHGRQSARRSENGDGEGQIGEN